MDNRKTERVFKVMALAMEKACYNLKKQNIPEVEAIISLITPRLDAHWQWTVDIAIEELLDALEDIPDRLGMPDVDPLIRAGKDRDKILEDLIAALLLSLEGTILTAPVITRRRILTEGARRLLGAGSLTAGLDLDLGDPRVVTYPLMATEDALLGARGRFLRRRKEVKTLIYDYLTNKGTRSRKGGVLGVKDGPTFEEALGVLLGQGDASTVPQTVDSWAYRWFNVGTFAGALQAGQTALVAQNNPPVGPDAKTSPFCRWVHGRIVEMSKIERQLDDYRDAIMGEDPEAQIRSWPFISAADSKSEAGFKGFFSGVGLPPYHGRCRTVVYPRAISP